MFSTLLTGLGLSFSTGLNAYLPLLILALADRFSSTIDLANPYDRISSTAGLLVILVVLPLELFADKIPTLDHYNDLLHTAIRPLVGAFCVMAVADESGDLNVWVAALLGLIVAGTVHVWKMRSRPKVNLGSKGIGTPWVSMLEDGLAMVIAVVAIYLPVAVLALVPLATWLVFRSYTRMASGESRIVKPFLGKMTP